MSKEGANTMRPFTVGLCQALYTFAHGGSLKLQKVGILIPVNSPGDNLREGGGTVSVTQLGGLVSRFECKAHDECKALYQTHYHLISELSCIL